MAQDTQTPSSETEQSGSQGRDNRFHYYSGGEVKELADSRPNSLLYIFYGIVIVGAVFWFLYGGALGPKVGGYKPVGSSDANLNALQGELNQTHGTTGTYATVDLTQLPIPGGQNINQAISAGSDVYQSYCIGCHGPNQDGNGVNAEALNPKPRNLHDAPFMQAMSYQRITTSLHKGVPGTAMPRWENLLSERQIGDVIAYVFSLTSPAPGAAGTAPAPAAAAEQNGAQSGGSKTYVNGIQNSPKPITPAVNGNPAAPTNTAPPSQSGLPADQTGTVPTAVPAAGTGTEASKPLPPSAPDAGGASVTPPFSPGSAAKPKHAAPPHPKAAAPIPGTAAPSSIGTSPANGNGGTGM